MSESTPETNESSNRSHLQPVRSEQAAPKPAQSGPVSQPGGHMTGLLALLLAVAMFALLAQYSANQNLQAENVLLSEQLTAAEAELAANAESMSSARDALGGLKDVLARVEALLAPPAAAVSAGTAEAGAGATDEAATAE